MIQPIQFFFLIFLCCITSLAFALPLPKYQIRPQSFQKVDLPLNIIKKLSLIEGYIDDPRTVKIDLNEDGVDDYIFMVSSNCGTGGCGYGILDGKTQAVVADFNEIFGNPIFIFEQKVNHFSVITTYSHFSASSGFYTTYVFDGSKYRLVSSIFLKGESVEELFKNYEHVPLVRM